MEAHDKTIKAQKYERVTQVERDGKGILLRLNKIKPTQMPTGRMIYENPSTGAFPNDHVHRDAVDAAYEYLMSGDTDYKHRQDVKLKAMFATGIFIGMLIMGLAVQLTPYF
jgi:hypothetical protein